MKVRLNRRAGHALFTLGNDMLKQVHELNYFGGQTVSAYVASREICHRIGTGWYALSEHFRITNSKLPLSLKRTVPNKCVLLVTTCKEET